jgi:large subunit ribosomal protein L24
MKQSTRKIKIRKGDAVVVIAGKDKGKQSKVLKALPQKGKLVVDGVALRKRHQRPKKQGQKGQVITEPMLIDVSNIMLFCSACSKGVRTGYQIAGEQKERICKKCKNKI